jgi:uncharacterized protein YcbX
VQVTGLFVYPLKAARALPVADAVVERRGLAGDRRWMLVDPSGRMISQREEHWLALLTATPRPGGLRLAASGRDPIEVAAPSTGAVRRPVVIFGHEVEAAQADAAASGWLSAWLGRPVELVYMPDDVVRPVDPRFATAGDQVSFADGYPLLLTAEASLADLNRRMAAPLPMDRFRPNLVIDGDVAFAEEGWRRVRIGEVSFRLPKGCDRCVVTTIDQATAQAGVEPLRTLAKYRRRDGRVWFGQNLVPDDAGTIRVGDRVIPLD